MTSWSTLFHSLIEAGHVGPAIPHKDVTGMPVSHWFWGAADKIASAQDKNQTPDAQDNTSATPAQDADQMVNDIILETPQISGAALVNAMKAKGLRVVSVVESWHKQASIKLRGQVKEGGPGSGPQKGGARDDDTASDIAAGKLAIRKADAKVAKIQSQLDQAKASSPEQKIKDLTKAHADAKAKVAVATAKKDWHSSRIAQLKTQLAQSKARMKSIKPKTEADSGSSFPGVQVKQVKEMKLNFSSSKMRESTSDDGVGPTRFKVVLLQEGLGNLHDAFYYSKAALESAVTIFTGSKIYADHPSTLDEETRPERSVRDVLGHFENIQVEEADDRCQLTGELVILPDKPFEWARALALHAIEHSKKFPEKEFVGLSINASGDAQETPIDEVIGKAPTGAKPKLIEAKNQGIESVKVVSLIKSAVSCDLVTEAGAGGKFINFIERK